MSARQGLLLKLRQGIVHNLSVFIRITDATLTEWVAQDGLEFFKLEFFKRGHVVDSAVKNLLPRPFGRTVVGSNPILAPSAAQALLAFS
jgi:hypothetical protein